MVAQSATIIALLTRRVGNHGCLPYGLKAQQLLRS